MHIHAHVRNLLSSDVLLPRNSYLAVIHGGKARVKEKGVLRGVLGLLEGGRGSYVLSLFFEVLTICSYFACSALFL